MPKNKDLHKVLVIGSGPIIIGQAAEFDYAGSQACRALKEEGIEVVLVNSNPATIMTDTDMADRVYLEPLTADYVAKIVEREKPDGLLPTLGGQVGLNIAREIAHRGVLSDNNVRMLGTSLDTIEKAEDREKFKNMLAEIGEPVLSSGIASTIDSAFKLADEIGYPVIVRPAYTMGGAGGGMAADSKELEQIVRRGLKQSIITQVLIERSVTGWKEIEFEVMRDKKNTCITICSMENIDPIGVHTGDSIVAAPALTLTDYEFQLLRTASLKIIRALGIEGGCNVQYALDTNSFQYYVIEVNPRVSRSSALASKATGYPIARVATKIAIGYNLDEISNSVTGKTSACFEPTLDYCVVKYPRWAFDKFATADRTLGTQMKATGEVMALGRSFEETLLKAVRSLEIGIDHLQLSEIEEIPIDKLKEGLQRPTDIRLFLVAEALRRGMSVHEVHAISSIDSYFLAGINNIILIEEKLKKSVKLKSEKTLLFEAKKSGFSDTAIARFTDLQEKDIRIMRGKKGIKPVYKQVDTCAAEFEAETPYYYSTYDQENESRPSTEQKVLVIGSGPIRIGQGIEFDYCSVHAVRALKEEGYESIIVNNNPETVSTDFDISDRLYFEPLTAEDVLHIIELEKPIGVIVQFGGQTAINLVEPLVEAGVKIIGTGPESIDNAEDRDKFDQLLEEQKIARPPGGMARSLEEAESIAARIGYPVLVRPSYVLGGRAMEIVYQKDDLKEYMKSAVRLSSKHPVLIDKYLKGIELEVDAVADGQECFLPGIMEHIERAGIHSGDSIAVYPTMNVSEEVKKEIYECTEKLARALHIQGLINVQYVYYENQLYVLEVNPRSSRTVPFMSKVTGIPLVKLATRISLGATLKDMSYEGGIYREPSYTSIKCPVFSFSKLSQLETSLGPEMKSTGEVMGLDRHFSKALYKAQLAAGLCMPLSGNVLLTIADKDKEEAMPLIKNLAENGFDFFATKGTAAFLTSAGIEVSTVCKLGEGSPNVVDMIQSGQIDLVINTLTKGKIPNTDGFQIRRAAVEHNIPCFTSLDTALATGDILAKLSKQDELNVMSLQEYLQLQS